MKTHSSHNTRVSMDASSYDEICENCGATDTAGSGTLHLPCPRASIAGSQYDADYFLRGKQTGKSLYEDYRWLPDLTIPMAQAIAQYLELGRMLSHYTLLDFGCARGYLVRALREIGYVAYGYDASDWAIANADPAVYHYLTRLDAVAFGQDTIYDWIIAKDVLEHVEDLTFTIMKLMAVARVGVFVVVPLSKIDNTPYVVPEYEKDVTHIHRKTLATWAAKFMRPGWSVTACYRVPGIKDNYAQYAEGNGFITARRL